MTAASPRRITFSVAQGAEVRFCRACGAPMAMRLTPKNVLQPINCPDDAYRPVETPRGAKLVLARGIDGEAHFATCPDAARFRRPRGMPGLALVRGDE